MRLKIIDIGNSKGIRLPKGILQQLGRKDEVSLETSKNSLILKAIHNSRFEWAKAFHEMAENSDDKLLDGYTSTSWDYEEWEWK
jgi:antitoxin MazE